MSEVRPEQRLDFFVSHAGSDEEWAEWIAQQLQNAGYTVELDVWNWSAGIDVIQVTQRALDRASRMLAVWTPEYFTRRWADMEHRAAVARSQLQPGWLLPVVVRACPDEVIPVLYRTLIRVELVELPEVEARERLLAAVEGPSRPRRRRPYPGEGERDAFPGRLPPIWNVPNRNPFFIGREAELDQLAGHLSAPGTAATVAGREGIGGLGKSELAVEYAWRHASEYRLVWWLDAGHHAGVEASLIELATLLDAAAAGGLVAVVPALRSALDRRADWLLIVDNVPDRERLAQVLPTRSGRVIVTSRDHGVLPACPLVVVGPFSRAESVRLLRRRCSWLGQQAAERIAAIVDDLPVAVAQASQFLARTAMAADEYLPRLIEQVASGAERGADAGLAATVAVAQERLLEADPAAADLLDQLALLADEPVPLTAAAFDVPGAVGEPGLVVSDPETTSELVSSICGLGLAVRVGTNIQLQARVRPLLAGALTEQRLKLVLGRVLRLLATADPGDPAVAANWPMYVAVAPHVEEVTQRLQDTAGVTELPPFQRLLDHVCQYLRLAGRAQDAYRLADAAHGRRRRTHGDDDPQTIRWAVNRGAALAVMGRHQQAREALEDALARQQRLAGADHTETLHAAGQLGVTLVALGEHEAARKLLQDVLGRRRSLGPDSPETLRSAADLGVALTALGYHTQARQLFEDVTAAHRRILGDSHLDTLASAHELGVVLAVVGDHDAARGVLEQVVDGRRSALGPDHLDTLTSAHRLGALLAAIGDHEAARVLLDDTATRRRAALGADHLDTLASAHELGVVLAKLGNHVVARDVLKQAADGRRSALGANHPEALNSAHHLGAALSALGDLGAAREVLSDTAVRRGRTLGPNHQDTLETERALRWL